MHGANGDLKLLAVRSGEHTDTAGRKAGAAFLWDQLSVIRLKQALSGLSLHNCTLCPTTQDVTQSGAT